MTKDEAAALCEKILDGLAVDHDEETFVSSSYGYYEDAAERFTQALLEASKLPSEKEIEDAMGGYITMEQQDLLVFLRERMGGDA